MSAVFRAEPPDGNPEDSRLGVVRIDFSVYGWVRDEVFSQAQQQFNARFCLAQTRCPKCRPDDTADFVHTACLQQAKASIPGFSTRTLRDIAQYARPLLPWHFAESLAGLDRNPNTLPLSSSISTSTELGQLLEQIERRLPFELQDLILDDVEGFFRILSASCTTLSWYRQSIKKQGLATQPLQTTFPLRHCPEIKKIGANFTPILGEICLKDIGEGSSTPFEQAIDVAYGVRGFQYSIGAYGVVAFRVLYNDGAPSPWLGGGKDRWTTTYEAADLTKLYAVSDVRLPAP